MEESTCHVISVIVCNCFTYILNLVYRRPFGVEQEFFVQLFVEYDANLRLPTVGDLLRKMFHEQHISFTKVRGRFQQIPYIYIWLYKFAKE